MTDAFLGFQNVTWDKKRNTAKYDLKMWWQHIGNPMKEREREREMEAKWRRGKAKKQPSAFHGMFPWHASMRYLSCVLDCILISSSFKLFEWRAWNDSAELDSTLQLGPHRSKAFPRVDWSCPICPCSVSEISVDLILFPHLLQTSKSAWSEAWGYALCCWCCCCWLLVVGCGLLVVGCWLLVVGCWLLLLLWLLVVGCWLLVVGCCWLLVVGCWLLVVGCWLLLLLFVGCCVVGCWLLVVVVVVLHGSFLSSSTPPGTFECDFGVLAEHGAPAKDFHAVLNELNLKTIAPMLNAEISSAKKR